MFDDVKDFPVFTVCAEFRRHRRITYLLQVFCTLTLECMATESMAYLANLVLPCPMRMKKESVVWFGLEQAYGSW